MRTRGISIVELLLALYLLALGLATTAYIVAETTRALSQGKLLTHAAFFAQARMEEALTAASPQVTVIDPDVPELTGEVHRLGYSASLTLARATVYRSDDSTRRPLVELECLSTNGVTP